MGKNKERRKLEAIVADKSLPKAERKAAKALLSTYADDPQPDLVPAPGISQLPAPDVKDARDVPQGPSSQPAVNADALPGETEPDYHWRNLENKAQLERHQAHLARVEELAKVISDPATKKKARAAAEAELEQFRLATAERAAESDKDPHYLDARYDSAEPGALEAYNDSLVSDGVEVLSEARDKGEVPDEIDDAELKRRVKAKRATRAALDTHAEALVKGETPALVGPAESIEDVFTEDVRIDGEAVTRPVGQVAEVVETEHGREFAVGAPAEEQTEQAIERDYLGRPKIVQLGADGQPLVVKGEVKTKPYTRTTTYIDCLEDTSTLEKWKLRMALEGVVLDWQGGPDNDTVDDGTFLAAAADAIAERDKAFGKIAKRERKGELELGQFGLLRAEATKAFKDALDTIASDAMERAGVHEKAAKGTNLHALTAMLDEGKISLSDDSQLEDLIEGGLATHADIADLKVYAKTMAELGIQHVAVEQFVVIDSLGVAGTLDRASMFKLPGSSRRIRLVSDIKTGRIDYSAGKIGMQLRVYAEGKTYDPANPAERGDLKLSKSKGLLIHLPQGEARCEVYVVDLDLADQGVKLAGSVRSWRNTGKRVFDLRSPLKAEAVSA